MGNPPPPASPGLSWLEKLGLNRPELRAWALYDVANSAWMTTIILIFPLYFVSVAAADRPADTARSQFAFVTAISVILVGLLGPLLGTVADLRGNKKAFLGLFLAVGAAATAAMSLVTEGRFTLAVAAFVVANVGVTSTLAFYNALLPGIARPDEVDRVSTAGFALGYLGGGLLFAINSMMIASPQRFGLADANLAIRVCFLSVALWWVVFSIPLFLKVPEPAPRAKAGEGEGALAGGAPSARRDLPRAASAQGRRPPAPGLPRLQRRGQHHHPHGHDLRLRDRDPAVAPHRRPPDGPVRGGALRLCLRSPGRPHRRQALHPPGPGRVRSDRDLRATPCARPRSSTLLAFFVGTVQGGAQGLSRSLFATLIPRHKAGEMFGFFGVFDRFGGAIGSLLFGIGTGGHGVQPTRHREPRRPLPGGRAAPHPGGRGARAGRWPNGENRQALAGARCRVTGAFASLC